MSKKGRKCRRWHHERIRREFEQEPETIIQEMFEADTPLTVMAGVLGISYGEMHEWVEELGLKREAIARDNPHPVKERLRREHGIDAVRLICSERANRMSYEEIRGKYEVSSGFIANCLHEGAPWLIGTPWAPVIVRPPKLNDELRAKMAERCREHNRRMKQENRGWFRYGQ